MNNIKAFIYKDMKRNATFKVLLMFIVGLFLSVNTFAQQIVVKGIVKDTTGEPIIGANVIVKGTTNGTITDFDGNFLLNANKGDIIIISFIGYRSQEAQAAASMNIILKDDTELLDEVVVIGYGSVKKDDLSGSVVAIKAEEMNKGAVTSPQELIMGKVPGLSVSQGDGAPGAGSTIRIRGGASLNASNDPLIVIDGIPVSNDAAPGTPNALATINPNDIETFTVLKDASATAIYGSRASNGVIIIQTKKGTQDKIKVSYSGTFTAKDPYKRIETLDAQSFREVMQAQYPEGTAQSADIQRILNVYPNQSTDWQDAIYQTGLSTDQNIGIAGKAGFMPFRISLGYNTEKGTLKTSDNIYTAMVYFDGKAADGWKFCGTEDWGTDNWGAPESMTPEQSLVTLVSGNGGDIKAYSKNSYYLEFNNTTGELKVSKPHNSWGIVGDHNSWGSGDTMMTLETETDENNKFQYYLKATLDMPAGNKWKIRPEEKWEDDIAPGAVEGEFEDAGDGNFKVSEAGNYTIKWYFNKVTPKIIVVKNK